MKHAPADALTSTLNRFFQRTNQGIRPGLDVIQALLQRLDQPQRRYPYIHVAGTNGKGSVCAMLASVLRAAGYKTGCYTSPHLRTFNERIQIDGAPIPDTDLAPLIDQVEAAADDLVSREKLRPASFFECATAMAFTYFAQQDVDWAVIETGMGGRWDATNIDTPALAVLTEIDMDHIRFLGPTIESIAREKAGIIKSRAPVVSGPLTEPVKSIIEKAVRDAATLHLYADEHVQIQRLRQSWEGQKIRITTDERACRPLVLPLIGRHQLANAALAVAALETLAGANRIVLPDSALEQGLAETRWPARCELLAEDPVTLLDVAHNPNGAQALARTLSELAGKQPIGMIIGFLDDKDVAGCVRVWAKRIARFWTVSIDDRRGLSADAVARIVADTTDRPVTAMPLDQAKKSARQWARAEGGIVCIAGSLFLAGEVMT